MKRLFTFSAIMFAFFASVFAQINEGGTPMSFHSKISANLNRSVQYVTASATKVKFLKEEDLVRDLTKDQPWRFGENIPVDYDLFNSGTWDMLPDGSKIWRLGIFSPGALSINLIFDNYYLPEGARLFIYSPDQQQVLGAFTNRNNQQDRVFATTLLKGDAIIIEYYEPANAEFSGELSLDEVIHGYRNAFEYAEKAFGSSGSCNNNVACAVSNGWEDQIRSVCMLVSGGSGFCTGALVNNTQNDGTPYVLTANHCYSTPSSWVFWFNWESATCNNPASSPSYDAVSGAVLRARNSGSDFCLVEMNSTPPAAYNVYYSGWDHSGSTPTSQTCIHHPSGDIKKISFDNNSGTATNWGSPTAAVWQVGAWEDGTTEPGSSGSPLFDQNHRIIGQLFGGSASCSNMSASDYFGRFNVSWDAGANSGSRLVDWLDPTGSGVATIDGWDLNTPTAALDARPSSIIAPTGRYCGPQDVSPQVIIVNVGTTNLNSCVVSYSIDGGGSVSQNWSGNLSTGQTATITFPQITLTDGVHTIEAFTSSPNGSTDENTSNDLINSNYSIATEFQTVELSITTDNYGSETSWEVVDDVSGMILYSGGGYPDGGSQTFTESFCLGNGCYTFNIYDAYGDGICCSYGNGSYSLSNIDSGDDYVLNGGSFNNSESTNFCVTIVASSPPVADFTADVTSVCAGSSVQFTDISTNTPTSWSWSFVGGTPATSTQQNPVVVYDTPGSYKVTLDVSNASGSNSKFINNYISVNAVPTISATPTDESYAGACDGSIVANASGGTNPLTYNWDVAGNTTTFSPGGIGDLPISSTVVFDLPVTGLGNLDGSTLYIQSICLDITHTRLARITDISLIAPDATSVQLTGGIGGTSDNYTGTCFSMSGADGAIVDGTAPYTGSFVPMGDFASFYNNQPANGTWQLSVTCGTTGGTLNSWEITFGEAATGNSVTNVCAGTYNVTVTDGNGCEASTSATVGSQVLPLSASLLGTVDASCNGLCDGQATISITGGTSPFVISWPSGGNSTTETGLCAGTFTVTITDATPSSTTVSGTINQPTMLTASLTVTDATAAIATDGSISSTVSGGVSPYTYFWTNGATTPEITGLAIGDYCVTITDFNSCYITLCDSVSYPVGISGISSNIFRVIPNPTNGQFIIKGDNQSITKIEVVDMLGKVVRTMYPQENRSFNISSLSDGVYFINIKTNKETVTERLILTR